jgi:hypothetical protein
MQVLQEFVEHTTVIAFTDRCISGHPQVATPPRSGAGIRHCDEIDSAAAYTNTCRSHDGTGSRHRQASIAGYVRWTNKRATPKRNFAVNSKIRRPDYLPTVA